MQIRFGNCRPLVTAFLRLAKRSLWSTSIAPRKPFSRQTTVNPDVQFKYWKTKLTADALAAFVKFSDIVSTNVCR